MNRDFEINNFLNHLAKIYSQNPNLSISSDTIYHYLMNYDMSQYEIENNDIRNYFDEWYEHFKQIKNIDVWHSENQTRFLQFSHGNPNLKCVKLYLSFPKDKIYECVNKVFEFVASNKMVTHSKVADMLRSDSVVLRLDSIEDVEKVINFVNNDLNLSNSCKKTNPFLIKEGHVGIAYDHMLSYNSTLSFLLEQYFKYCRMYNRFNEVSSSTFKEYVDNFRRNVFSNEKNCFIFLKNPEIFCELSRFNQDKAKLICNYEEVMQLISLCLDPNMTLDKYFSFYNQCLSEQITNQRYSKYNSMMNGQNVSLTAEDPVELLNEYIKYTEKKYGGANISKYLNSYVKGNTMAITRDNGFRNRFRANLTPELILEITNNNIVEYIKSHIENKPSKNNSASNYEIYLNACIATYRKYGANQLYNAIINSINGDYSYFTNSNGGYRDIMISRNFTNEVYGYCMLIIKTYGDGLHLSNNLYVDCTNAIVSYVKQQNGELKPKLM